MKKEEILGELSILCSALLFAVMTILVRSAAQQMGGMLISFYRFVIGAILTAALIRFTKSGFEVRNHRDWLLSGACTAMAMLLFFIAITMTSSARATLLGTTKSIFVILFGMFFFGERITVHRVGGLVIALAGVILIFYDNSRYGFWGNAVGLLSGFFSGLSIQYIKRVRATEHSFTVYLSACLFGVLLTSYAAPQTAVVPVACFPLLLLVSLAALAGQLLSVYGYRFTTASKGSIMALFEIPAVIALGHLFLGEHVKPKFIAGTILIIAGLVINQELLHLPHPQHTGDALPGAPGQ